MHRSLYTVCIYLYDKEIIMDITLHGNVAELVNEQIKLGGYESPEDLVFDALQALVRVKIDQGIEEGLEDVRHGRVTRVDSENLTEFITNAV
jgi:hypothetical protein